MCPLHRRPEHGTQDIVDMVEGLRRVACLRDMSHVYLDLLSCHLRYRQVDQ
jgi:hypothetical protein